MLYNFQQKKNKKIDMSVKKELMKINFFLLLTTKKLEPQQLKRIFFKI